MSFKEVTPEGLERLRHSDLLYLDLKEGFDLRNGRVYFFSIGSFIVSQIDPETGDFVYEEEAAESIRRHQELILYPPNVDEGCQIIVQLVDLAPDGTQRQASLFFVFRDHDWQPLENVGSTVVDLRPGLAGFARTLMPF